VLLLLLLLLLPLLGSASASDTHARCKCSRLTEQMGDTEAVLVVCRRSPGA
jgi:hypothetical protein